MKIKTNGSWMVWVNKTTHINFSEGKVSLTVKAENFKFSLWEQSGENGIKIGSVKISSKKVREALEHISEPA